MRKPWLTWAVWALLWTCACQKRTVEPAGVQVAVIGGGASGLTAAYTLNKQGISTHIFEEQPTWGGRINTATYAPGQTGEYGMQELWSDSPLLDIARDLNVIVDSHSETAFSSMVLDGKLEWFQGNTTASYLAGLFDPNTLAVVEAWRNHAEALYRSARSKGLADPNVQHLQDISLLQWLQESGMPPRAQTWMKNTLECEMATGASETSALAALLDMEMFLGAGMAANHIRGGNSQLIRAIAQHLHGHLSSSAKVTAVRRATDGFDVHYEQDHTVHRLHAQRVVVAVPFWRLHQILFDPALPGDVWSAVNSLRLGQYTVVHFLTDAGARSLWTKDGVTPFPVLAGPLLGAIYGPMPQGANDSSDVFNVLLFGASAKTFHMMPREIKVTEIEGELDALWPGFSKHVRDAYVYTYHPSSLPVWPPGRSSIDELAQHLRESHGGIYLVGDYTRGAHATGAAWSGRDAAERIIRDLAGKPRNP